MKSRFLVALLCGFAAGSAVAETLVVNDHVQVRDSSVDRPKRGSTMEQVEAHFGAPTTRHPTVGQPPITRWDYPSFSVFFERDRVIDSVMTPAGDRQAAAASQPAQEGTRPTQVAAQDSSSPTR